MNDSVGGYLPIEVRELEDFDIGGDPIEWPSYFQSYASEFPVEFQHCLAIGTVHNLTVGWASSLSRSGPVTVTKRVLEVYYSK